MSKLKLELDDKTDTELLSFAEAHIKAMEAADAAAVFPTPMPSVADFRTAVDHFTTALRASDAAAIEAKAKTAIKEDMRTELQSALNSRGAYVETQSAKDPTKILMAGFQVRNAATVAGPPPAPGYLNASMGTRRGEIKLDWGRVKEAKSYVLEVQYPGDAKDVWHPLKIVVGSTFTADGLTPGEEHSFRVRGVGIAGDGPWSAVATKMAPA